MESLEISTDKFRLDVDYIAGFISNTYWAKGRTRATMQVCIDNSVCFGVYLNSRQIGFARVLTDFGHFAYLMDVFIDPLQRGKGYSKKLMEYIMAHHNLKDIKVWRLATLDAHGLYKQFGFRPLAQPENLLEII